MGMNTDALFATVLFAGALMLVFGLLYRVAAGSHARGELGSDGIRLLQWGLAGQLVILVILGVTAFLT